MLSTSSCVCVHAPVVFDSPRGSYVAYSLPPRTKRLPHDTGQEMKARGVGVDEAVEDYEAVKKKLGADADTSGSRFNDAFRIARAENHR